MSEESKDKIRLIEQKVRVLEEENAQLAERAEDSLLLGLVSENIQNLSSGTEIIENTLERIAILKTIPYATCGKYSDNRLKPIATYATFSEQDHTGYPIELTPAIVSELKYGPTIIRPGNGIQYNFNKDHFAPQQIALIPFKSQTGANGFFLFMDSDPEENRFGQMLMLLNQVAEMAIAKHDNLFLLSALSRSKNELESRVLQRTRDLARANEILEIEIEERIDSERALKGTQQTFIKVLNSIDATIYVADMDNHEILFMNKNMIDAFGADLTGELCYKAFRGEERPCGICTNKQLVGKDGSPGDGAVWQGENPKTGKTYINYDRAIKWIDGRTVRLQIATDITQLKEMELQLNQSQKFEAIGTLAGGVAHDFNNLLMGIQGRISLMSMDPEQLPANIEHIEAIEDYVRSATDLTRQLLGFARGGKYEVKSTDINELVRKSVNMFGRTKKELRIHGKFHKPAPVVKIDRSQIEQVMINLYVNAWQAMPLGGELYLETKITTVDSIKASPHQVNPGRYVNVIVTDTGTGMQEETRQRIFDPFFTTKEKERGTGLGLASAYGIVKNHDGYITVTSEIGQGTSFNIYLPLSDTSVRDETLPTETFLRGSETILLIDDEQMILDVGQAMLENLGYQVLAARNGEQALAQIEQDGDAIDLIILDLVMPGMDGGMVFNRIRELYPQMAVLLSSGYAIDGQAAEIMQRGCNGFIQKPFSVAALSEKVRHILDETKNPLP